MILVAADTAAGSRSLRFSRTETCSVRDDDVIPYQVRQSGIETRAVPLARDFVRIAAAVHLADRQVRRSVRSGHRPRRFSLTVPVSDARLWRPIGGLIERMATFASQDIWHLKFSTKKKIVPSPLGSNRKCDVIALFSGGLDSLCGAAHLAASAQRVLLLSHSPPGHDRVLEMVASLPEAIGSETPSTFQSATMSVVPQYRGPELRRNMFQEFTRRTRPFLYLSLASAAAIATGAGRVQMSENGALGASLPFRKSHYGPRITRQGHSFMLEGFEEILAGLRPGMPPIQFANPFRARTKGEACGSLGASAAAARLTLSCEYAGQQVARLKNWARRHDKDRDLTSVRQCGLCVPCVVRRAALKAAGIQDDENDYYFHAPGVLRDTRDGVEPFGHGKAPPLYHFSSVQPFYAAHFARAILAMKVGDFAVQYIEELWALRPRVDTKSRMRQAFQLQRRFAEELLGFLDE